MAEVANNIKTNRVLALSGGGVKAVAELMVLIEIEERTGKSISELFPIIAGTSVGGLIGALLTIPKEENSKIPKYSAKEALQIVKSTAEDIFPNIFLGAIKQIFTHKYDEKPLEETLEQYLGDSRMNSTTSRLIIPVTDLNSNKIEVFDSVAKDSWLPRIKDVIRATTAAPTYFSSVIDKNAIPGHDYASGKAYAYADGGMIANRPGSTVLEVLKTGHTREEQKEILDATMICSINFINSKSTNSIAKISGDGIFHWLKEGLVNIFMKSSELSSTDQLKIDLPGENEFFELKLPITKESKSLDDTSAKNIARLEEIGRKYVEENSKLIQKLCDNLLDNLNKEQIANQAVDLIDEGFEEEENIENRDSELANESISQNPESEDEGFENLGVYYSSIKAMPLEGEEHTDDAPDSLA